jgi:integrase
LEAKRLETFRNWCVSQGKRERTIQHYVRFLEKIPEDLVEKPEELARWLENAGYKPSMLYSATAAVKCYYKSIRKKGLANEFEYPTYKSKEKLLYMTPEQVIRFLNVCDDDERVLVEFYLETALRRNTVMEIKVKDIDWEREVVLVDAGYEGNKSKTNLSRPLTKTMLVLLEKYIKRKRLRPQQNLFKLFYITYKKSPNPLKGKPLFSYLLYPEPPKDILLERREYMESGSAMTLLINKIGKRIGLSWVTPHILRHTYATLFYSKNKDLLATKASLGHSSTVSTERYAHMMEDMKDYHGRTVKMFEERKNEKTEK